MNPHANRTVRGLILGGLALALIFAERPLLRATEPLAPTRASGALSELDWLGGAWRMEKNGRVVEETWLAPAGGLMLGASRTVAKGKAVEFEFMLIREAPGGDLSFVAFPHGKNETAFSLVRFSSTSVTFANPANDFPQTITYALQPDGSLLATIEGPGPTGAIKRIEFPYQRAKP